FLGHLVFGIIDVAVGVEAGIGKQVPGGIVSLADDLVLRIHGNAEAGLRTAAIRRRQPIDLQQIAPVIVDKSLSKAVRGTLRISGSSPRGQAIQLVIGEGLAAGGVAIVGDADHIAVIGAKIVVILQVEHVYWGWVAG